MNLFFLSFWIFRTNSFISRRNMDSFSHSEPDKTLLFLHFLIICATFLKEVDCSQCECPRKIFIDGGANHGQSLALFAECESMSGEFDIYSFEPNPNLHPDIEGVIRKYYRSNRHAELLKYGLWNNNGILEFKQQPLNFDQGRGWGSSFMEGKSTLRVFEKVDVNVTDLSNFVAKHVQQCDFLFLKLDVEGAEYRILDKMFSDDTIKLIDALAVEFHDDKFSYIPGGTSSDIMKRIQDQGIEVDTAWGATVFKEGNQCHRHWKKDKFERAFGKWRSSLQENSRWVQPARSSRLFSHKRLSSNKGIVLSSLLIQTPDPQIGHKIKVKHDLRDRLGYAYVQAFYTTTKLLNLNVRIMHDGLPETYLTKYSTDRIKFMPMSRTVPYTSNDDRFLMYLRFLEDLPFENLPKYVILNDVSDVFFQKNPFEVMSSLDKHDSIFASIEPGLFSGVFLRGLIFRCLGDAQPQQEDLVALFNSTNEHFWNAGLWGGRTRTVIRILKCMVDFLRDRPSSMLRENCNMLALNACFLRHRSQISDFATPLLFNLFDKHDCDSDTPAVIHNHCSGLKLCVTLKKDQFKRVLCDDPSVIPL